MLTGDELLEQLTPAEREEAQLRIVRRYVQLHCRRPGRRRGDLELPEVARYLSAGQVDRLCRWIARPAGLLLVLALLLPACSLARLRIPVRCPDGLPPRLLTDIACPPDSICGYSCLPRRWEEAGLENGRPARQAGAGEANAGGPGLQASAPPRLPCGGLEAGNNTGIEDAKRRLRAPQTATLEPTGLRRFRPGSIGFSRVLWVGRRGARTRDLRVANPALWSCFA